MASFCANAGTQHLECEILGLSQSGGNGTGTRLGPGHDREAYLIGLEYDGKSIEKISSLDSIFSYKNVRESDNVITGSARSEKDNAIVGSITIDRHSGRMFEVIFDKKVTSNVFAKCKFIKK